MKFKIYTLSDFAHQNATDLFISKFEDVPVPNPVVFPHQHDHYSIIWVNSGRGKQNIDFQEINIKANSLYFISPNQLHLMDNWQSIKGYYLSFYEHCLENIDNTVLNELKYFEELYFNSTLHVNSEYASLLDSYFKLLHTEFTLEASSNRIHYLIYLILQTIKRIAGDSRPSIRSLPKDYEILLNFLSAIEKYYQSDWTAKDYAEELMITTNRLNRVVKKHLSISTSQFIINKKIQTANKMLTFTNKSIAEIAFEVGFQDPSYFTRLYKKNTGTLPNAFRLTMHEKYQRK